LVYTNLDKITAGEYIDLDKYLTDEDTYDRAMAVLYRPIENVFKDLYNRGLYQLETYRKELEDMPLDIVLGSLVFFYSFTTNY
jgi:hypothetical protein